MAGDTLTENLTHLDGAEIQKLQLQIGSKLFPDFPDRSHAEAVHSLRKSLGVQSNHLHSIDITGAEYRNNKFIAGFDTEKLLGLSFTGTNTKNNMMTIFLQTTCSSSYTANRF